MYLGSWKIDDLLTFYANTTRFDTGNATDADAVPAYRVFEDETATPILTGNMALLDSANTAGFYSEQITLSAANGFEKGKSYAIYIAATVNSVAGATHHTLQLEAEVDANRLNWANVDNPTTAVNLSSTNIDVDQVVASVSGNVGGNVVGSVASVAAGGIAAATFAANAITSAVIATDAIGAAQIAADAIGSSELAATAITDIQTGLSILTAADVNAEVVDVLRTDTIPDSYAADGAQPTIAQAILLIQQFLTEKAVSSTTVTVKKPNGSTTAFTLTLDSATAPTSITRAT